MKEYTAYYLVEGSKIVLGPFSSIDEAYGAKSKKFIPPYQSLVHIVKTTIKAEEL